MLWDTLNDGAKNMKHVHHSKRKLKLGMEPTDFVQFLNRHQIPFIVS